MRILFKFLHKYIKECRSIYNVLKRTFKNNSLLIEMGRKYEIFFSSIYSVVLCFNIPKNFDCYIFAMIDSLKTIISSYYNFIF